MEYLIGTIITLLLGIITYFVVKTYNQVDEHGGTMNEIKTKLNVQLEKCNITHAYVDKEIKEIKVDFEEKLIHTNDKMEEIFTIWQKGNNPSLKTT